MNRGSASRLSKRNKTFGSKVCDGSDTVNRMVNLSRHEMYRMIPQPAYWKPFFSPLLRESAIGFVLGLQPKRLSDDHHQRPPLRLRRRWYETQRHRHLKPGRGEVTSMKSIPSAG